MRGLGLMSALASFYLLFTCVVSFFFGVKGSLDVNMGSSGGLRPSWAYVLTVSERREVTCLDLDSCSLLGSLFSPLTLALSVTLAFATAFGVTVFTVMAHAIT